MSEQGQWWIVQVTGRGTFATFGTDAEAELFRQDRASFYSTVARKFPADPNNLTHRSWVEDERSMRRVLGKGEWPEFGL